MEFRCSSNVWGAEVTHGPETKEPSQQQEVYLPLRTIKHIKTQIHYGLLEVAGAYSYSNSGERKAFDYVSATC